MKQRQLYAGLALGGAIGTVAAFLQMLEKLQLLADKSTGLYCNINSVFSCTNVLNAPQSSVFGFPNSLMCLMLFMVFMIVGLVGLTGGIISRSMRLATQFLTLFTLGFGLWFLWQSTYAIGAICIFCLFCFLGLLIVDFAILRLNAADLPISKKATSGLNRAIRTNYDLLGWVLLGALVAVLITIRFYL